MPRKTIKEIYTKKQLSNIVKNIFNDLKNNMTGSFGEYYDMSFDELEKIKNKWLKKYD